MFRFTYSRLHFPGKHRRAELPKHQWGTPSTLLADFVATSLFLRVLSWVVESVRSTEQAAFSFLENTFGPQTVCGQIPLQSPKTLQGHRWVGEKISSKGLHGSQRNVSSITQVTITDRSCTETNPWRQCIKNIRQIKHTLTYTCFTSLLIWSGKSRHGLGQSLCNVTLKILVEKQL